MKKISFFNICMITVLFLSIRCIPYVSALINLNVFVLYCFYLSLLSLIFSILMAPVIKRHIKRFNQTIKQTKLFVIIGIILYIIALLFAKQFSPSFPLLIQDDIVSLGIGYSLLFLLCFNIVLVHIEIAVYKALTDRMAISHVEGPIIIISALLISLMNVLVFMPLNITLFPVYLLVCLPLGIITAYLYNQTSTLVIPEIALMIAALFINTIALLV